MERTDKWDEKHMILGGVIDYTGMYHIYPLDYNSPRYYYAIICMGEAAPKRPAISYSGFNVNAGIAFLACLQQRCCILLAGETQLVATPAR